MLMQVREREVVALLSRNGAGERPAAALRRLPLRRRHDRPLPSYQIADLRLRFVPEERRIFGALAVAENLDIAALSEEAAAAETPPSPLREQRGSDGRRCPAANSECSRSRAR